MVCFNMDLTEFEKEILVMLQKKLNEGDKEIPIDIFEEVLKRDKSYIDSILESLKGQGYIKYECECAMILNKGLNKLQG